MASYNKLITFLKEEQNHHFLLIAHERPDGDTVSATMAMRRLLLSMNKQVALASSQGVPDVFKFLADWPDVKSDFLVGDFDAIILIDNGDLKRTGYAKRIALAKKKNVPVINIDHHPKNDIWKISNINVVDESASSTCELIFELYGKLEVPIDYETATMLLTGIYTDTGGFQHSNVSAKTLEIASNLMSKGARLRTISSNIFNHRTPSALRLWGIALKRISFLPKLDLNYSVITRGDIEESGAKEEDLAGVVNLMSSIPGEHATLLLYETADGKIKGSLRTESSKIDVSKIAAVFGGGGHKKASGFVIDGKLAQTESGWKIIKK